MRPGDLIEWKYLHNGKLARSGEVLWSTPMRRWVSIAGPALVISVCEGNYAWISDSGMFHAREDDTLVRICDRVLDDDVAPHPVG